VVPLIGGDPVTGAVVGSLAGYEQDTAAFEALWFPG